MNNIVRKIDEMNDIDNKEIEIITILFIGN